jgi:hypothetical protein
MLKEIESFTVAKIYSKRTIEIAIEEKYKIDNFRFDINDHEWGKYLSLNEEHFYDSIKLTKDLKVKDEMIPDLRPSEMEVLAEKLISKITGIKSIKRMLLEEGAEKVYILA